MYVYIDVYRKTLDRLPDHLSSTKKKKNTYIYIKGSGRVKNKREKMPQKKKGGIDNIIVYIVYTCWPLYLLYIRFSYFFIVSPPLCTRRINEFLYDVQHGNRIQLLCYIRNGAVL